MAQSLGQEGDGHSCHERHRHHSKPYETDRSCWLLSNAISPTTAPASKPAIKIIITKTGSATTPEMPPKMSSSADPTVSPMAHHPMPVCGSERNFLHSGGVCGAC